MRSCLSPCLWLRHHVVLTLLAHTPPHTLSFFLDFSELFWLWTQTFDERDMAPFARTTNEHKTRTVRRTYHLIPTPDHHLRFPTSRTFAQVNSGICNLRVLKSTLPALSNLLSTLRSISPNAAITTPTRPPSGQSILVTVMLAQLLTLFILKAPHTSQANKDTVHTPAITISTASHLTTSLRQPSSTHKTLYLLPKGF